METRVGRRILSGLLIIALSITMLFVDCSTADARTFPTTEDGKFSYYVSDDFACVASIEYLGTEESVIIPETIEGVKVDRLYSQAFMGKPIRSVEGKSIEIIGGEAFKNCTNLEEVNFPNVRRFTVGISFDDINSLDELQQVPLSPYAGATYPGSQDGNHKTAPTPLPPN